MKRPSFQFYPGDWMRDAALRSCSVGARGLWMDMLCLMHEGTPYGYLKVNLKVILPANLARIVGATLQETEGWLAELESAGVFSRAEDGSICSRRMIRDENIREARASGGKLGGNPALKDNHKVAGKVNLTVNLPPTPSSSSSSPSSIASSNTDGDGATPKAQRPNVSPSKPADQAEAVAFFTANGSTAEQGQTFYDHFTANGWKQGGKAAIKDWPAAARNWIRRGKQQQGALFDPPPPVDPKIRVPDNLRPGYTR